MEVETRHASKAYRKGVELDHLRGEERQRREQADRDHRAVVERSAALTTRASELGQAEDLRQAAVGNLTTASDDVHQVASGLGADHLRQEMSVASDTEGGEAFGLAWVGARRRQIGEVRGAIGRHSEAVMRRGFEEERLSGDQEMYDRALTVLSEAESAQQAMSESYNSDVAGWARASSAFDTDQVLGDLGRPPFEPEEVEAVVNRLRTALEAGHAVAIRDLEELRHEVVDRQSSLLDEKAHLDAGRQSDPEPPTWRDNREGRSGAPLWRLVELVPGVGRAEVDGVEAALNAAGLLDAWVSPDGVVDVSAHDLELVPGAEKAEVGGRTLADILVPLPGGAVASDRVAAVLASIPVGPHAGPIAVGEGAEVLIGTGRLLSTGQRGGPCSGRRGHPPRRRGPGAPSPPTAVRGGRRPGPRCRRSLTVSSGPGTGSTAIDGPPMPISTPFPRRTRLRQAVHDTEAASQRVVDAEGRVGSLRQPAPGGGGFGTRGAASIDLGWRPATACPPRRTTSTGWRRSSSIWNGRSIPGRSGATSWPVPSFASSDRVHRPRRGHRATSPRPRRRRSGRGVRPRTPRSGWPPSRPPPGSSTRRSWPSSSGSRTRPARSKGARQDLEELRRSRWSGRSATLTTSVAQAEQDRIEAGDNGAMRPTSASSPWPPTGSWPRRRWGATARSTG